MKGKVTFTLLLSIKQRYENGRLVAVFLLLGVAPLTRSSISAHSSGNYRVLVNRLGVVVVLR